MNLQLFQTQQIPSTKVKAKEHPRIKSLNQSSLLGSSDKQVFEDVIGIPVRSNKQDQPPPHQNFRVSIQQFQETLVIVAVNLSDQRDYFEIKVEGSEDVEKVLNKFQYSYQMISQSLRIMNEVMVLLNPKILHSGHAQLNEQSFDDPGKERNSSSRPSGESGVVHGSQTLVNSQH